MRETIEQTSATPAGLERVPVHTVEDEEVSDFYTTFEQLPSQAKEVLDGEAERWLQALWKKDETTLRHSLGVTAMIDQAWPAFAAQLEAEGITYPDLIRAAALHDVGKLDMPDCILKSALHREQLGEVCRAFASEQPEQATALLQQKGVLTPEQTVADISEAMWAKLDYRDAVSLGYLFRNNPAARAEIIQSGLDPQLSFYDALKMHEGKSAAYLTQAQLPNREIVASLAGSHHNYRDKADLAHPRGSALLKFLDTLQTMTHGRQFQEALSENEAQERITGLVRKGILDEAVVNQWRASRQGSTVPVEG